MNMCRGDGSKEDGDIRTLAGLGNTASKEGKASASGMNSVTEVWNGKSCNIVLDTATKIENEQKTLEKEIMEYMQNPSSSDTHKTILGISAKIAKRPISSLNGGPLVQIGSQSFGQDELSLSIGSDGVDGIDKLVDTKNKRIAAFPEFVMDWLTRQTEELTTSLFTPPNLTIIPPTNFGQNAKVDGSYSDFLEKLQSAYSSESINALKQQMGEAYHANNSAETVKNQLAGGGNSRAANTYSDTVARGVESSASAINSVGGGLDAIRSAYTFIGKLPFISLSEKTVNINVPWILPSELDQYERKLKEYKNEIERAKTNWCVHADDKAACLKQK